MSSIDFARIIWENWRNGTLINSKKNKQLIFPKSRKEGYEIQNHYSNLTSSTIFGWKIAASNKSGQEHIGVKSPLAGILLEEKKSNYNEKINLLSNNMLVAEIEFIFKIKEDINLNKQIYSDNDVLSIVDSLYSGVELPGSRFLDYLNVGEYCLIADNACANQFILGPKLSEKWRNKKLADQDVYISINNDKKEIGSGKNVLGNPLTALKWLINEFLEYKIQIKKGHFVASGTLTKPIPFKEGDTIEANYGDLGNFKITL